MEMLKMRHLTPRRIPKKRMGNEGVSFLAETIIHHAEVGSFCCNLIDLNPTDKALNFSSYYSIFCLIRKMDAF